MGFRDSIRSFVIAAAVVLFGAPVLAQEAPEWARGLDELMAVQVTSVSRKEQRLADTSAAVYVLTRDEIRRSGMTTVPDLLRLVPGLHVAQIDANKWAITARGFNSRWSNKLLVMIDGRSIYTPYFAGVFWDAIDVPVDVIERIEVVRGPGASIWGANAVNGVINIITAAPVIKRETIVSAGAGSLNPGFGRVTHEGRGGDRLAYRLFGNTVRHGASMGTDGATTGDDWNQQIGGGWVSGRLNTRDTLEASVRASATDANSRVVAVTRLTPFVATYGESRMVATDTWNAFAKWTRQLPDQGHLEVESYVDQWLRDDELDHHRRTVNVGLKHRVGLRGRHDVVWGSEYRRTAERTHGSLGFAMTPTEFNHDLVSIFAQDEIAVAGDRGRLVAGSKLEHREFTGWNVQPTARFHWRFNSSRSAWVAASRAFRAPDRVERAMSVVIVGFPLPTGLDALLTLDGNPDIDGEWLTAYESGYRMTFGRSLTVDLAAYFNRYSRLMGVVPGASSLQFDNGSPYLKMPIVWDNVLDASTVGGEAAVTYSPAPRLRVTGGYTLFTHDLTFDAGVDRSAFEGPSAPRHQVQIRSSVSVSRTVDLDATYLAVGGLAGVSVDGSPAVDVPAYARLDTRLGWRPRTPFELSFVVQNVTDGRHIQFSAPSSLAQFGEVPRSAHLRFGWRF